MITKDTNSNMNAALLFKTYGINRSELRHHLYHSQGLHMLEHRTPQRLANYFVLVYEQGIKHRITYRNDCPFIIVDDVAYSVHYKNLTAMEARTGKVKVSYRRAAKDFGLPAVALVSWY